MQDFAEHTSEWVQPISTTYKGYTLHEMPPNNQGLTALILLNILEGIDLASMKNDPVRYYHTLIEASKIAFSDRNRYIADPAFSKAPLPQLLVEGLRRETPRAHQSAAGDRSAVVRRVQPRRGHDVLHGHRQGPERRVVHQQHLQRLRIGHRRGRHRHHAAQPRHGILARDRPSRTSTRPASGRSRRSCRRW